ncbi:MAG: sulfite exporter TauE/SafE family protein [Moraxellaceae bacterium]|nr:sulfite exporter TauE/SafE family protein [Moraxellaceae bacterium]
MNLHLAIALGAMLAGFVQGFSGFAFGLVAMAVWAWALEPTLAGPLVVLCSLAGQFMQLRVTKLRDTNPIAWRYIAGGLPAVPLGVLALQWMDPRVFKLGVGALLVGVASLSLLWRDLFRLRHASSRLDYVVGTAGGFLGGVCGLVGALPSWWSSHKPIDRLESRQALQVFFTVVHIVTIGVYALRGLITTTTLGYALLAFAAMYLPARAGATLYHRLDAASAQRAILGVLLVAGVTLLAVNR